MSASACPASTPSACAEQSAGAARATQRTRLVPWLGAWLSPASPPGSCSGLRQAAGARALAPTNARCERGHVSDAGRVLLERRGDNLQAFVTRRRAVASKRAQTHRSDAVRRVMRRRNRYGWHLAAARGLGGRRSVMVP
jgi:hypothetical protein